METKEFYIKDIFETLPFRGGLQVPTGGLVPSKDLKPGKTPRISVTSVNNGITGFFEDIQSKNYRTYENCISVSFLGSVFYHPYKASFDMKVHCLKPVNHELKEEEGLYLVSCLKKLFTNNSYGYQTSSTDLPEMKVVLPVTADGTPDWNYMTKYIQELEAKYIQELDAYLVTTGLDDYELTEEDKAILATKLTVDGNTGEGWKAAREFAISDVFEMYKGKRLTKAEHIEGTTPFIGSTDSNNGITDYIGQEPIFRENAITISYNGSVGQVFYQEEPFWASDDINVLYLKEHLLNAELFSYLGGALKKAGRQFSYSYKWNMSRMKDTKIILPITLENGVPLVDKKHTYHPYGYIPDWNYMECYIKAMEKVVIADVVKYKNEKLVALKEFVN